MGPCTLLPQPSGQGQHSPALGRVDEEAVLLPARYRVLRMPVAFSVPRDNLGYREGFNDRSASILTDIGGCEVYGGSGLLLYPRTSIPAVKYSIDVGETVLTSYVHIFP